MKKNLLEDVRAENYFWLKDGGVIKNLKELSEVMNNMSDDTFNYHVNDQKNDFSNWIKDVHQEEGVAEGLLKAKTKEEAADYIRRVIEETQRIRTTTKAEKKKILRRYKQKTGKKEKGGVKARNKLANDTRKEVKQQQDKPYTISGIFIALAILFGLVALIDLFKQPTITGAAVGDLGTIEYNWFAISVAVVIVVIVLLKARKKLV